MPALDLWPLLEQLEIKTKNAKIKRLNRNDAFAWAQREFVSEIERQYNNGEPVRIIVLKGRQLGLSTVTEAVLFIWAFLHPGTNALVLSKKQADSEYLFGMFKRYWESGPFRGVFSTSYNREGFIQWAGINSSVTTETAKSDDVGRGRTLQAVHGSEVAFWPNQDGIIGSLSEAIPYDHGTIVIYESTANGVGGYFHDEWQKAIDPTGDRSSFTPMFFPWWEHDEYAIGGTHLKYGDLDDEERVLLADFPDKMTIPKLAWRRRKLQSYSNPETFKEEYPMSQDEAFLTSGSNVFPQAKLAQCYDPEVEYEQGFLYNDDGKLAFAEDEGGHLFVYKRPDPHRRRRYVVACDPTFTIDGDPACIDVLDRDSMEQVAVWHGSADPDTVGDIALAMAYWYGPGTILNTEVQGGGKTVLNHWRDANYPHIFMDQRPDRPKKFMAALGWNSTYETKKWMLGTMQGIIQRKQVKIHHPATYYEMTRYISNEDGTYGPSRRSGHDDTVIALGIALMTIVLERAIPTDGTPPPFSAPAAPYVPGMTKPTLGKTYGTTVVPGGVSRFGVMADDDMMIGVEAVY